MDNKTGLAELVRLVARFEKLDAEIEGAFNQGDKEVMFNAWEGVIEAKKDVKRFLAQQEPLVIGPDLALKLKKIRDNYGYFIDDMMDSLASVTGKPVSQESEGELDYVDALFTEGTADYVDEHFFRRRNQVGTLIGGRHLPAHISYHFTKLRECFALGLFEATVIYCRAVMETACFAALKSRGDIKGDRDIREFRMAALMNSIRRYVPEQVWNEADKVVTLAGNILHSKREKIVVSEEQAFDSVQSTLAIVEDLFR
ncbi:MAG: hypothetical protein FJ123_00070 [Deltaproteobacteria bacterium]|nr:hypothetical protein [Deltaproteobacteria bacterium]